MTGTFIVFEGIDGSGKTTQLAKIAEWLISQGKSVLVTKEPGGTPFGQEVRKLLEMSVCATTELLLFSADRKEHLNEVVRPALANNSIVLCDRFHYSTDAYQWWGRQYEIPENIFFLNQLATDGLTPNLVLLFDVEVDTAMERVIKREEKTRIEREGVAFYERVRHGYLTMAGKNPQLFSIVDANRSEDLVFERTKQIIMKRLELTF
jgi:dTMP kinase